MCCCCWPCAAVRETKPSLTSCHQSLSDRCCSQRRGAGASYRSLTCWGGGRESVCANPHHHHPQSLVASRFRLALLLLGPPPHYVCQPIATQNLEQLRFLAWAFRLISPLNSAPFFLPSFLPPPELSLLHPQSQRRRRRDTIPVEINLPISFLRVPSLSFPYQFFG